MTPPALDALLVRAAARGEVVYYLPVAVRRERAPAVMFATMPAGGVK